jgi:hypothetical protein
MNGKHFWAEGGEKRREQAVRNFALTGRKEAHGEISIKQIAKWCVPLQPPKALSCHEVLSQALITNHGYGTVTSSTSSTITRSSGTFQRSNLQISLSPIPFPIPLTTNHSHGKSLANSANNIMRFYQLLQAPNAVSLDSVISCRACKSHSTDDYRSDIVHFILQGCDSLHFILATSVPTISFSLPHLLAITQTLR